MNRSAPAAAAVMALAASLPAHAAEGFKDASIVTMSEPTRSVVPFGESAKVSGTVSGVLDVLSSQKGRRVTLQLSTPTGWMPLRTADVTDADGQYSVAIPSSWYYRGKVRTAVAESDTHLAGHSLTSETVTVKPPYAPKGRSSAWTHLLRDPEARWNPCRVITFKVNPSGGPDGAVQQVKGALRKVAAATGLRFRYEGTTRAIPWRTDGRGRDSSGAALTIAWATPRQVSHLQGSTAGWGGGWSGNGEITKGGIALDRTGTSSLKDGFGKGATWGALLMHEIGHVIGLGHVRAEEQVMHSSILAGTVGRFGAGDLAGLSDQGAMGGCIRTAGAQRTTSAPRAFATY